MAVKNNVPVVPCFITMEDTKYTGPDGYPVQAYTPHVGPAIYPDPSLSKQEARDDLCRRTESYCREVYEKCYVNQETLS